METFIPFYSKITIPADRSLARVLWISLAVLVLQPFNFASNAQPLEVNQYGVDDGLPTYFVKDILQDSLGYMYIASDEGLSVYNGLEFTNYTQALQSKYVKYLYKDHSDAILVVTDGGISKATWEQGKIHFSPFIKASQQLKDSTINYPKEIYQDKAGFYWVSEPNALSKLSQDGELVERFLFPQRERSTSYFSSFKIFELNDRLYTVSEKGGIYHLDRTKQAFHDQMVEDFRRDSARIKDIYQTDDHTVLIAATNGLYTYSLNEDQPELNQLMADKHLTALTTYENGHYLFATNDSDLYTINKSLNPASITLLMEASVQGINSLYRGSHHSIWATSNQGAVLFKPKLLFQTPFPDRIQYTRVIKKSGGGDILGANNTTLYSIKENGNKYSFNEIVKLEDGQIRAAAHSSRSDIYWIGAQDGILLRYQNGKIKRFEIDPKPSGVSTAINLLFQYSEDQLWVVREQLPGIIITSINGETRYAGPESGLTSQIADIYKTESNKIYLGADGAGEYLFRYDANKNTFENISHPLPFSTEQNPLLVYDISSPDHDQIYLATNYGILIHADHQVKKLNLPSNFPTHLIRSVEVRGDKILWIGTENGVFAWQRGYLRPFNSVKNKSNIAVNFRSLVNDRKKYIWAGTIFDGLIHIPWNLTTTHQTPAPKVTKILAGGTPIERGDNIKVLDRQHIEFQYHSMIYPAERVYYQTRIPELSNEWTSFQQVQKIEKSNLPVGDYQLQIRALHSTHQPSSITTIPFKIVYPWYARWFTISGALLFISVFGLIIYYFRRETIKRRLTQIKLRKTEQKLQAIISNTPIILYVINKEGYFVLCEGEGLKRLGFESFDFENKHYRQIFSEAYYRKKIKEAFDGKEVKYERTIKDKTLSGRLHPVFDDDHNVIQIIGISIDITERADMEHKLIKARNEAVRANEAKSTFLANMSHELRTPLNAILGYTQILQRHKNIDPKIRDHLDVMYKSGKHLLNMINDVLDLSKIESGQVEIHTSNVNFRSLLEEIVRMFKPRADEKNLRLELIYSSDLPPRMMLDGDKIRQIIINLVSNAITYTETGGVIVKAKHADDKINALLLSVCDTGIGIPKEQRSKIFTPFIQSDPSANTGTGLGLSITKNLVTNMGGEIEVTSNTKQDSGTCFTITLPYKDATAVVEGEKNTQFITDRLPQLEESCTALLADDIPENLYMLSAIVEDMGFDLVTAADGEEAVELFKETQPDIIITDIIMPKLSGKEAFEKMKSISPGETPPIIALTASGMRNSKQELLRAGFDAYFRKPFEVTELAETIVRLLGENRFMMDGIKAGGDQTHIKNGTSRQIYHFLKEQLSVEDFNVFRESLLTMDKEALNDILEDQNLKNHEKLKPLTDCLVNNNFRFLIELNDLIEDS